MKGHLSKKKIQGNGKREMPLEWSWTVKKSFTYLNNNNSQEYTTVKLCTECNITGYQQHAQIVLWENTVDFV